MAEPKRVRQHALQLQWEYRFDRLLSEKLAQVYQVLVPEKRWSTGAVLTESGRSTQEVMDEQNSVHLRARLFGPP